MAPPGGPGRHCPLAAATLTRWGRCLYRDEMSQTQGGVRGGVGVWGVGGGGGGDDRFSRAGIRG